MFRGTVRSMHFVGIGGIGMSGIAEVMLNLGYAVTGSDLSVGKSVLRLRAMGATVHLGHDPDHVVGADVVVRSTAVDTSNPEIAAAIELGIPVIRRAEMLAELMRLKYGIAVAGSHGKTTTTSMIAACLAAADLDPTVVIGGRLDSLGGSNAKLGQGDFLVAEADESDGTFTMLSPTVALVTNIDPEHLDHYGDEATLRSAFLDFANKVPFYGFSVLCLDHHAVQEMIPHVRRRVISYGLARHADVRGSRIVADGMTTHFRVHLDGELRGEVALGMPGHHNVLNALGAIAVATALEVPFETARSALDGFTGVQRRFTLRGEQGGVTVVDDYAHHPVEIEATLDGAVAAFPDQRILAVFQPHRYSRVSDLFSGFCGAFFQADEVVVCPVYAAGEVADPLASSEALAAGMRERGHRGVHVADDLDSASALVAAMARPGDVVITLGAGDVTRVPDLLLPRLAP